jgi:hypothetical protein
LIPTFDVDVLKFGEGGLTTYKESNRIQFAKKIHVYITVITIALMQHLKISPLAQKLQTLN